MSWRRVAVIYALVAVLAAYVAVFERDPPRSAKPDAGPVTTSLLGTDASAVTSVTFTRGAKVIRTARELQRWRVVDPPGLQVSPDLIEATVATLTTGQVSEILSDAAEGALAAYGLDTPDTTIEVSLNDTPERSITVLIGAQNPTRTAVYARRSDQPTVFLVGMNLRYYVDLIFEAGRS